MAQICPSCGAPYNGRRCRQCLYENFSEEVAHGSHTHQGEPLVIEAPARRPIPRKDPFDCPPKPRRKFPNALAVLIVVAVIAIFNASIGFISAIGSGVREEEAKEAVAIPVLTNSTTLYSDDQFTVTADWQDGQEFTGTIPLVVDNESSSNVNVTVEEVVVNDWLLEDAFCFCQVRRHKTGSDELYFNQAELDACGIRQVQRLSFRLEIYDSDSYETLLLTEPIVLTPAKTGSDVDTFETPGQVVYREDGLEVYYTGYQESELYPDSASDGCLGYYLVNGTDEPITFYCGDTAVNGQKVSLSLYAVLPPHTRALTTQPLYALEWDETGIETRDQLKTLEIEIIISDQEGEEIAAPVLDITM